MSNYLSPRGMSTIELLIAFAILCLTLTAIVTILFGNQVSVVDARARLAAQTLAAHLLSETKQVAHVNYLAASSTENTVFVDGYPYRNVLSVTDDTLCKKLFIAQVAWDAGPLRHLRTELVTTFGSPREMRALGGDCPITTPHESWGRLSLFAAHSLTSGAVRSMDVLDGHAYLGLDTEPYVSAVDTRADTEGSNVYIEGSVASGLSYPINDIDAIRLPNNEHALSTVLYLAQATSSAQLAVVTVDDSGTPILIHESSLDACVHGSYPQGWRIFAYDSFVYLVTRETAGPEFHIFDARDPRAPLEIGSGTCRGYELTDTVEEMVVRDQYMGGTVHRLAFLVTDESDKEVRILDVTSPSVISEVSSVDIPGTNDAMSLYLIGTQLYVGRQSTASGPELYQFDVTLPTTPTLRATAEIGASVHSIRVAGPLIILATSRRNQEIQIWDRETLHRTATYRTGGTIALQGLDYDSDTIYSAGTGSHTLQLIRAH